MQDARNRLPCHALSLFRSRLRGFDLEAEMLHVASQMATSTSLLFSVLLVVGAVRAQESGWLPNQVNATMCQWQEPRGKTLTAAAHIETLNYDGASQESHTDSL